MFGSLRSLLGSAGIRAGGSHSAQQKEGERLLEEFDYAGAELRLAEAIVESERRQESAHQRILLRLELAQAQRKQYKGANPRKLSEAGETLRSALELASRLNERALSVQVLDELIEVASDRGDLEQAERLMHDADALEASLKRRDPLQRARRQHRVGMLRQQHGRLGEAVELLRECAAAHEQTLGENHSATANRLSDLGAAYLAMENHSEAQPCLRRAMRIHERERGLDSPEAAADLQMLTESLEASGDIQGAASQFERVLALKLRIVGLDLNVVAEAQWDLAQHYLRWQRYSRARELLMEAVGTFKRTGGARLAEGYDALGQLEEDTGHYHEALRELGRAGKVWESVKSEHLPELLRNLEHRIFLLDLLRQHKEADFFREQATALAQAARWAEAS